MARGIGGFLVFFVAYMILGSLSGGLFIYLFGTSFFWSVPAAGSLLDRIFDVSAGVVAGLVGVILGFYVLSAVMKSYPARGIATAFILWLVANYGVHFAFFPKPDDFEAYAGLVQSAVACVTAWFVFGLPPLSSPQSNRGVTGRPG
jgi:hypothetical protein